MSGITRIGISMDSQLLKNFDRLIEQISYLNRSEAIRDLIRASLVETGAGNDEGEMVGTITLVFDHHVHDLIDKLTDQQHVYHDRIISALHVHLDAHNCLEVLVARRKVKDIKKIIDELLGVKGVKHGKLVMTSTGEELH